MQHLQSPLSAGWGCPDGARLVLWQACAVSTGLIPASDLKAAARLFMGVGMWQLSIQLEAFCGHQMGYPAAGPPLKAASKTAPDVANPWEDEEDDEWEDVNAKPAQPAAPSADLPGGPSQPSC